MNTRELRCSKDERALEEWPQEWSNCLLTVSERLKSTMKNCYMSGSVFWWTPFCLRTNYFPEGGLLSEWGPLKADLSSLRTLESSLWHSWVGGKAECSQLSGRISMLAAASDPLGRWSDICVFTYIYFLINRFQQKHENSRKWLEFKGLWRSLIP